MDAQSSLPVLRAARLRLRPVDEADLELLIELNSDPAVMTHIRGRAATPDETTAEWLGPRPEISGIGYRLCRAAWGRGLATEGARTMTGQAFTDPGVEAVFASTKDANTGSRHVLEKLGMTHISTSDFGGVGYELTRADWLGLSP